MRIEDILIYKDYKIYIKLKRLINYEDIKQLMKHDTYRRSGRRIKQIGWE